MRLVRARIAPPEGLKTPRGRRLFVTVHRRENHERLESDILPAIRSVVERLPDVDAVVAIHPNPKVALPMRRLLANRPRIQLLEPMDYPASLGLVRQSALVITDSGGLQEEATALGTPVVVVRRVTERMEAVTAGNALVIGTGEAEIAGRLAALLEDTAQLERMSHPSDVFGDGYAADRIARRLIA